MPLIENLYAWLATGPTPDCDGILAAALEKAESPWFERMLGILRQRGHAASWAALITIYGRLPAEYQKLLQSDPRLLGEALERALGAPQSTARLNAIQAFQAIGSPKHSYLLVGALRDSMQSVRTAAGQAFRRCAENYFAALADDGDQSEERRARLNADRHGLARAAQEALRTFDLHHHVDALETCLWFAADLGPAIWEALGNPRSRAANVVATRIPNWNNPRMGGFLLACLGNNAWRQRAMPLLQEWTDKEQLVALLRAEPLLHVPEIRKHLALLRGRPWISINEKMDGIPRDLWKTVPRWITLVQLKDDERAAVLGRWLASPVPEVQRHTVYALSLLNTSDARRMMRQAALSRGVTGTYARWYLVGGEINAATTPPLRGRDRNQELHADDPEFDDEPIWNLGIDSLWKVAKRTGGNDRSVVVELIREFHELWGAGLARKAASDDPRERLIFLQTVATRTLAPLHREELKQLAEDAIPAIRQLAEKINHGLQVAAMPAMEPCDVAASPPVPQSWQEEELRRLFARLQRDPEAVASVPIVLRLREQLRAVCGATIGQAEPLGECA